MTSFNEYFGDFLTHCKDEATISLKQHKGYADCEKKQSELYGSLVSIISPEAQTLLQDYVEAVLLGQGMEQSNTMLCGMITLDGIHKCLDKRTPEYQDFLKKYILCEQ